jgi:hypothetical protein
VPGLSTPPPGLGGEDGPRRSSPFAAAAPSIVLALLHLGALLLWLAIGDRLPGGRWLAVHLFTLGVLTNLVLTFSEHFSRTVTRTPGERSWWWPAVTNAGVLLVLVGLPTGVPWLVVAGTVVLTGVVVAAYRRLRRMRHQAVGARFAWLCRIYERAHGAFVHGAVLGGLLGAGLVAGGWYAGVRAAHLHANVLGWGGLTLLATLVFFGPTMTRTRIEPGADAKAARALRHGASGLTAAVLLLIVSGAPGAVGTVARAGAAAGLAVLGWATVAVCVPVARAALRAKPTAPRWSVVAVCGWFCLVVWADVAVVATGTWRWLDALGVAALAGVLGQAIVATLTYLAPLLRGRTAPERDAIRTRLEVGARTRAAVFQVGVGCLVLAAARLGEDLPLTAIGWASLIAVVLITLASGVRRGPSATPVAGRGTPGA